MKPSATCCFLDHDGVNETYRAMLLKAFPKAMKSRFCPKCLRVGKPMTPAACPYVASLNIKTPSLVTVTKAGHVVESFRKSQPHRQRSGKGGRKALGKLGA